MTLTVLMSGRDPAKMCIRDRALLLPEKKAAEIIKPENEVQQILFDCIAEVLGYTDFGLSLIHI